MVYVIILFIDDLSLRYCEYIEYADVRELIKHLNYVNN